MIKLRNQTIAVLALFIIMLSCSGQSSGAAERDPFASGSRRASILIGNGYAFSESYLVIGVGVGYFAAKGLANWHSYQSRFHVDPPGCCHSMSTLARSGSNYTRRPEHCLAT